jgi:tetratricopeptide (TPR) repeat protein
LGYAYALAGRFTEALPLLEHAASKSTAMKQMAYYPLWVTHLSEAHLLAGRLEKARQLAGQALTLARDLKQRGHEAYALRLLGELGAHGDPTDVEHAETSYRQALALAESRGMRPLVAHCHFGLGKLYRRTGKSQEAQEHLTTATSMYREMDMRFWLEKAETEMRGLA